MAANPQLVIRIAANVEELKRNLAEGKSSIEALGPSVQKMAATWSANSEKLIQNARTITAAVDQLGASTLTAADAARNLKQLEAGMAQLSQTGQKIPPLMQETAEKLRAVGQSTTSWKDQINSLAGALGVSFSLGAVVAFGKGLLELGDHIVKVADRTGLTTTEVQRLSYVAEQSGNTIDDLTSAIGQMQNRLASGDDSAINAVKYLHINLTELKDAAPGQQLEMMATAIAKIPDPAIRTQVAMDLFGKTGAAILPTLTAHFAELAASAPVMSDNTVRALDAAGDQLNRFGTQIKVWAAESYNYLQTGFESIIAWGYKAVASLLDVTANVVAMAQKVPGASKVLGAMGVDLKGLTTEAQWFRDAADAMSIKTDKVTESAKRLAPPLVNVAKETKEAKKAFEDMAQAELDLQEESDRVFAGVLLSVNGRVLPALANVPPHIQRMAIAIGDFGGVAIPVLEHTKTLLLDTTRGVDLMGNSIDGLPLPTLDLLQGKTAAVRGAVHEAKDATENWGLSWKQVSDTISGNLTAALTHVKSWGQAFSDIWHSLLTDLLGSFVNHFIKGVMKSLDDSQGGMTSSFKGMFSGLGGTLSSAMGSITSWAGAAMLAVQGVSALINHFRGGEEGTVVNPARDAWFAQNGGSVEGVAQELAGQGVFGEDARVLIQHVFDASTKRDFDAATAAIASAHGADNGGAQAAGGDYMVTRPTLFLAGEAGPERATFSGAGGGTGASSDASHWKALSARLESLTTALELRDRRLPHQLATALKGVWA